jgi:FkbM family methyltransferase
VENTTREFWSPDTVLASSVKRRLRNLPFAQRAYGFARSLRARRDAPSVFENADDYSRALYRRGDEEVVLRTHDGLSVTIRQNLWDAEIVREIFFEQPYTRYLRLPAAPVVVDVGGYIGEFALYAAQYLGAAHVVSYEPTRENFAVLERNVALNDVGARITAVPQAVGSSGELVLNVHCRDDEIHASEHWYRDGQPRTVPSVTLAELFEAHRLDQVDLLKVDCEGGEYDILGGAPDGVLDRVRALAFEYHEIDGFEARLEQVLDRLTAAGYRVREDHRIVAAWRD